MPTPGEKQVNTAKNNDMKRAFISLYLVIVLAIVLVGWGMDKVWELYNPKIQISAFEQVLIDSLTNDFNKLIQSDDLPEENFQNLNDEILKYENNLGLAIKLYALDELSDTELGQDIVSGETVFAQSNDNEEILYKRIANKNIVLAVKSVHETGEKTKLYFGFLVVFYFSLALVIYFWIWPLSRDLSRLERQTRNVGRDGVHASVELGKGSHVQNLADAFNSMSRRIRELLDSRKEMTYAVSHELRTPLARMKFAVEMASEESDIKKIKLQLEGVRGDISALDKFVNEFLSYARFDQHHQELEKTRGDFFSFCESIVAELDKGETIVEIKRKSDVDAYCDWQLMERVISNLLQNALRFADSKIEVHLEKTDEELRICIDDDGPGIPPENSDKIFNSFVRLENKGKGYGLGLAIVKRIVQWHGGKVSAQKSKLGGARFEITLPQS